MTRGGAGESAAAMPAQMAMGFGLAQEMVKSMQAPPPPPAAAAGVAATGMPELLSPAQAAETLGVAETDVIAALEAGDLKGKKIGTSWRITRGALDAFLAE